MKTTQTQTLIGAGQLRLGALLAAGATP